MFVYSPQLIENFRRSSADGLSLAFLITWLLGDLSNVLGAVLQKVLPTMTVLAIYYVAADFVLLGQWFYYHRSGPSRKKAEERLTEFPTEQSSLLRHETTNDIESLSRRGFIDVENPTAPSKLIDPPLIAVPYTSSTTTHEPTSTPSSTTSLSALMISALHKISIVVMVCFVGVIGWYISSRSAHPQNDLSSLETKNTHSDPSQHDDALHLSLWGQFFGYLCAAFYLGSRVPQLMLNYSRKSTEGVSILFFIFCCLGNVTYTLSIFAYEPRCAGEEKVHNRPLPGKCEQGDWKRAYWKYILVDASWVIGSIGALVLDLAIFSQFWLYRGRKR